ncbi:PREDICTED: collagen alpha-1(I) chain-like, partial [Chinchilla lanigera]|uniref:collagen alpha-1(I) chain-like n=1 Tax=Chinchilla lanigera TaxID=34839 RepID=UPI00069683FE
MSSPGVLAGTLDLDFSAVLVLLRLVTLEEQEQTFRTRRGLSDSNAGVVQQVAAENRLSLPGLARKVEAPGRRVLRASRSCPGGAEQPWGARTGRRSRGLGAEAAPCPPGASGPRGAERPALGRRKRGNRVRALRPPRSGKSPERGARAAPTDLAGGPGPRASGAGRCLPRRAGPAAAGSPVPRRAPRTSARREPPPGGEAGTTRAREERASGPCLPSPGPRGDSLPRAGRCSAPREGRGSHPACPGRGLGKSKTSTSRSRYCPRFIFFLKMCKTGASGWPVVCRERGGDVRAPKRERMPSRARAPQPHPRPRGGRGHVRRPLRRGASAR